jgi:hypothetical protein
MDDEAIKSGKSTVVRLSPRRVVEHEILDCTLARLLLSYKNKLGPARVQPGLLSGRGS